MSLENLFQANKIFQFVIHFACRTATISNLSPEQKNSLVNLLQECDPDNFQRFEENIPPRTGLLFQAIREYPIQEAIVTGPTFIMTHDSVSLIKPIKIGTENFLGSTDIHNFISSYMPQENQKMSHILLEIQNVINGLHFRRAGKVFEFSLGVDPDEKTNYLKSLFSCDLSEIGEINTSFTKYKEIDQDIYNIKTSMLYQQKKLDHPFQLNIRVDINNRNFKNSLEPQQVKAIWSRADSLIEDHINNVLNI